MKKSFLWAFATIAVLTVLTGCEKEDEDAISMDDVNKGVIKKTGKNDKEYSVVDLGLSVLWATCNIGADSPEQYGDYFAWGETQTKSYYAIDNYAHCNGDISSFTKYTQHPDKTYLGTPDRKKTLEKTDDAATQLMGENWRVPQYDDFEELRIRCSCKCCKLNGTWGYLFTSTRNGNSIFFPLSGMRDPGDIMYSGERGYYWSNQLTTLTNDKTIEADVFDLLKSSTPTTNSYQSREIGLPIRPVYIE